MTCCVSSIVGTERAFAALKSDDGSVQTWGFALDGGSLPDFKRSNLTSGVSKLFATSSAFAALKVDGSVHAWGNLGGDTTGVSNSLSSGVTEVAASFGAFAALKSDGSVVTWGSATYGADSSGVQSKLRNITNIFANREAFAAINSTGGVITWGGNGGDSSSVADLIASGVTTIGSSVEGRAFAAIIGSTGKVVTWGDPANAGNLSDPALNDLAYRIFANRGAMCALDAKTLSPTTSSPSRSPITSAPTPDSVSPTRTPTTRTPISVSPTMVPSTGAPTVDFSNGIKISDNMIIKDSASDVAVKAGAFILQPVFDATVERDYELNQTVIRSMITNSVATGYIGVKIWRLTENGKELEATLDLEWDDRRCKLRQVDCTLLPLSNTVQNTAALEFRAPMLAENVANPYIVTWVDPTGVVRAMLPEFNAQLYHYNVTGVQEGTNYAISRFWEIFYIYFIVLMVLLACVFALLIWACRRLRRLRSAKSKYILDIRGYRTTEGKIDKKTLGSDIQQEDKIRWFHWVYIALVFLVQATMALLFTITFFVLVFLAINASHFDVLKQYPGWAANRDSQLNVVIDAIDDYYEEEIRRIEQEFTGITDSCNLQDQIMTNAYNANKTAIKEFHDSQFQNPPVGTSSIDEISMSKACNIAPMSGAEYEKNNVITAVFKDSGGVLQTKYLTAADSDANIIGNLSFWCSTVQWCKGYSFDAENRDYYLFKKLPDPHLPTSGGSNGSCYVITRELWPTIDEVTNNLTALQDQYILEYEKEVNEDISDLNNLISATNNSANVVDVIFDNVPSTSNRSTNAYSEFSSNTKVVSETDPDTGDIVTTETTERRVVLVAPNIPDGVVEPVLARAAEFVQNVSTTTLVNASNENVTILNQMKLAVVDVNLTAPTIPKISDYVEYPQYQFPDLDVIAAIIAAILIFDITWIMIRWFIIATSTAQYIVGIKETLGDREVGKPSRWLFDLFCKKLLCCGCLASCYKCCMELDTRVWALIYRIFRIFVLMSFMFIIIVGYILVDGLITADALGAFGVFGGMTLQQEIQRTIRNEEISQSAFQKNSFGSSRLTVTIQATGVQLLADQFTFNRDERARVDQWNTQYCSAASEYVLGIHTLQVSGDLNGFPNGTESRLYTIERDTFGIPQYFVDRISLNWGYTGNNNSAVLRYRTFLTDVNTTSPITNATFGQVRRIFGANAGANSGDSESDTYIDVLAFYAGIQIFESDPGFFLQSIIVGGRGQSSSFVCPKVTWRELDFVPNDYLGACARIDPILGRMMRIWDRGEWSDVLRDAHRPYITAIRSIALSPFVIIIGASMLYTGIMVLIFILEWIFTSAGLIRTRRVVEVPVVVQYYNQASPRSKV
ncbi:hypothetical protein AAMO2058_001745300 [Amorphochlora amoebiformis]